MQNPTRRLLEGGGMLLILALTAAVAYFLLFYPGDISARQTENRLVFGATYMTMNNPYYQVLDNCLRSEIEANGDVLLTRDAAMDQDRQNGEIEELISAGAQVIFLTPVEWDTARAGLEAAAEAGVPVIVVDAPVRDAELAACSILSDNYQAGVLCAEHLTSVRDGAKIILLEHISASSGVERIQGFRDTIEEHEGFTILASGESDGQIENAMPVMEELLRQAPEADVLMALNDPSAFGGLAAIEGAGLTSRFLIYSVDGSPEAKALVNDGLMTGTCAQFPSRIARAAAAQGYRALDGGCDRREIIVPVELLTADNVGRYGTEGWQ
ncbi:sugar ABC transporter substrate-binding protein [Oscillibacter sp.]|uniref:sugar ABC transporter substrate-binding protein n=1 Tax=Oscillibacter sp. TaxID=1945593 RepID=UPI002D7FF544|nr:sugar ABC transporter substrate-binding protein [Oscillibacter sp.]